MNGTSGTSKINRGLDFICISEAPGEAFYTQEAEQYSQPLIHNFLVILHLCPKLAGKDEDECRPQDTLKEGLESD